MFAWMAQGYNLSGTGKAGVYMAKGHGRYGLLETTFSGTLRLLDDTYHYNEADALAVLQSI